MLTPDNRWIKRKQLKKLADDAMRNATAKGNLTAFANVSVETAAVAVMAEVIVVATAGTIRDRLLGSAGDLMTIVGLRLATSTLTFQLPAAEDRETSGAGQGHETVLLRHLQGHVVGLPLRGLESLTATIEDLGAVRPHQDALDAGIPPAQRRHLLQKETDLAHGHDRQEDGLDGATHHLHHHDGDLVRLKI